MNKYIKRFRERFPLMLFKEADESLREFIETFWLDILKEEEENRHLTKDGYCCACKYDIAGFEEKLKERDDTAYAKGIIKGREQRDKDLIKKIEGMVRYKDTEKGGFNQAITKVLTLLKQ